METVTKNKAFTLIEMLVVVLIIGILAAIALPQYLRSVDQSRLSQAMFASRALSEAEIRYQLANGKWTSDISILDISFDGGVLGGSKSTVSYPWGYCYIACTNYSCGGCIIQRSDVAVIIFRPTWSLNPPQCLAKIGSERSQEICHVATQQDTPSGTNSGYNVFSF